MPRLTIFALLVGAAINLGAAAAAEGKRFSLSAAPALVESGLLKFILPRFSLKTGVKVDFTDDGEATQREGDVLVTNYVVEDSAEAGCGDRGQRRPCNLQTPSGSSSQRLTSSPGG